MDISVVKKIAAIVRDMQLSSIEVEDGDMRIKVCGRDNTVTAASESAVTSAPKQAAEAYSAEADVGMDFNGLKTVVSPMVGVFYSAAAPGGEPFVKVGDRVKKGDVLCIVEAMKLMNELVSDKEGEIVDVCAKDGDVVEYGQTLFKIF